MDLTALALALAYLGAAVGVVMVLPQIARIVRNPTLDGVSPWAWAMLTVASSLWLTYGLRTGSLPQIPGNVLLVTGAVAIVLLVPTAWSRPRRAATLAGVVGALVALSTVLAPTQVGFLAFGIGLFGMWPQVYETVWVRRGLGPSAISLTSQALKVASQVCWWTFAILTMDLPVLVGASMALLTNGIVTAVELARRRAAAAAREPGALGGISRVPGTAVVAVAA